MSAPARPSLLILGATGIIGSELSRAATAAGFDVSALSRGRRHNDHRRPQQVATIVADARDPGSLRRSLDGRRFDVVVDLVSFRPAQLEATLTALIGQCAQYVFISSATVYAGVVPGSRLTERSPRVSDGWSYPLLKLACEDRLRSICADAGQRYTIIRPYITYSDKRIAFGAWEADVMLPRLLAGRPVVIGDDIALTQTSLTHAEDLARGMVGLMGNPRAMDEDFHIASPQTVSWLEVYRSAAHAVGRDLLVVPTNTKQILRVFPELGGKIADRRRPRSFDNSKHLSACPGFSYEYSVDAGYQRAITQMLTLGTPPLGDVAQGRVDRLISKSLNPPADLVAERKAFAKALRQASPAAYFDYLSGKFAALYTARMAVRRARAASKTRSSEYGIG